MKLRSYMEIPNGYYKKLARVESSNNPNAKAKTSSATGLYQFIDSTWGNLVKEMGKDYSLEDRKDPKKSQEVIEYFTKKNENYLKKKLDRDPNEAELYLTHFLGMPRAGKLLKTIKDNPHTDISEILPENVVKANPFLKGKKAFEVYNWSAKKMGVEDYVMPKEEVRRRFEKFPEVKIDNTRVDLPPLINTPINKIEEKDIRKVFEQHKQKENETNFINAFKQKSEPIQQYNTSTQEDLSHLYDYIKLENDDFYTQEFANGGSLENNCGGPGQPPCSKKETELNFYKKIKAFINPSNWGLDDFEKEGNFDKAFLKAKTIGEPLFLYKGRRYSTKVKGITKQEEFKKYGITSNESTNNNMIRDRIQKSINPDERSYGYSSYDGADPISIVTKTAKDIITGKKSDNRDKDPNNINQDIFNLYLGKPVNSKEDTYLSISDYKPSMSVEKNKNYFKIKNIWEDLDGFFGNRSLNNFIKSEDETREVHNYNLGNFKISKGEDSKGKYLSYYDKWDLHPTGKSNKNPLNYLEQLGIVEDQSQGVGKPIEFYDRVYYSIKEGNIKIKK